MTVQADTEIPTIGDLLWDADRVSIHALPAEQRELLEKIGDALAERWPVDDEPFEYPGGDELDDHDDWKEFVDELRAQGVEIGEEEDDRPRVVAAVSKALTEARVQGEKDATVPSRANTAQRKAMRLLLEQRVAIKQHDPQVPYVVAEVRGDNGVYTCGYHPSRRGWRCTCPEPTGGCSHVAAVKMVVPL